MKNNHKPVLKLYNRVIGYGENWVRYIAFLTTQFQWNQIELFSHKIPVFLICLQSVRVYGKL